MYSSLVRLALGALPLTLWAGFVPSEPASTTRAAALGGQGMLAAESGGGLVVLGADGAGERMLPPPPKGGVDIDPSWSSAGTLAFLEVSNPSSFSPSFTLFTAGQDGASPPEQVSLGEILGYAWSPQNDILAYEVGTPPAGSSGSSAVDSAPGLYLATPGAPPHELLAGGDLGAFAWSPDGTALAVSITTPQNRSAGVAVATSRLEVVPISGGAPKTWYTTRGNGIDLASFWPNGKGLLFWLDTQYSASLAADGLPLETLPEGGRPHEIGTTLVQRSVLSLAPTGGTVAVQMGGDRYEMGGAKHIAVCALASARCVTVHNPKGTVGLDPTWASPSTVDFAVASAAGAYGEDRFQSDHMAAWDGTHRLYGGPGIGGIGHPIPGAGRGVVEVEADPASGTRLLVEDGALLIQPAEAAVPSALTGPLLPERTPAGYYGEVDWSSTFAWSALAPTGEELGGGDDALILPTHSATALWVASGTSS